MAKSPWFTVVEAAALMGVSHRQALRLLKRRDIDYDGRLLRKLGDKHMPYGVQASKYLVAPEVLREAMKPEIEAQERDIETLRVDLVLTNQKLEALRKTVRPLLRPTVDLSTT